MLATSQISKVSDFISQYFLIVNFLKLAKIPNLTLDIIFLTINHSFILAIEYTNGRPSSIWKMDIHYHPHYGMVLMQNETLSIIARNLPYQAARAKYMSFYNYSTSNKCKKWFNIYGSLRRQSGISKNCTIPYTHFALIIWYYTDIYKITATRN